MPEIETNILPTNLGEPSSETHSCVCGKSYKFRSGLLKHKTKCIVQEENVVISQEEENSQKEKDRIAQRERRDRLDKLYNTLDELSSLNTELQFKNLELQIQVQDLKIQLEDMHTLNDDYKNNIEEMQEKVDANTNTTNKLQFHFTDKNINLNSIDHFTGQITRCLETFFSKRGMQIPPIDYFTKE
jgi:chromosome segregation ATPase